MLIDVKKAFLYGQINRTVFVELPAEDPMSKTGLYVGQLEKAMYGTRDAPAVWQDELEGTLKELGFVSILSTPCLYYHEELDIRIVAHVDDMMVTGNKGELIKFEKKLSGKYEVKSTILGPDEGETREGKFLGRTIEWKSWGLTWRGDEQIVNALIQEWDLSDGKGVDTAGMKDMEESADIENEVGDMEAEGAARYRSAAAKLNYVSLDNPRVAFASKEVSRTMAGPKRGDDIRLKRILRYLVKHPVCTYMYPWQDEPRSLEGFSDSDWAGCRRTRRSTSGGAIMHGSHLIHHWSRTQAVISLSSCEAELNAALKMGSEMIGMVQTCKEWGVGLLGNVVGDCAPLKGLLERRGTGRVKHLELRQLWMQEKIKNKSLRFVKVPREKNPSDAMTHHWSKAEGAKHFPKLNLA